MSWFEYGVPERRALRKNVWLRVRHLPDALKKRAKKHMRLFEEIEWVAVQEIHPNGKVLLEFWCRRPGDYQRSDKFVRRYNVFSFEVDEDPTWICEGDLGRGYKA